MTIFSLILAAALSGTPVSADSNIVITTSEANKWIGSSVDVEAWNKPEIGIDQEVSGGNASDVQARVSRSGNTITVMAVYTGKQTTYLFGLIHITADKSFHWTVHVPQTRPVKVESINGRIAVTNVTAGVTAGTMNGEIRIAGAGPAVDAHTANGSIDATIATLSGGAPHISLVTSNGRIALHVPRGFKTHVDASTSNGRIDNPLTGGGGPGSASARTANGSIEITVGS